MKAIHIMLEDKEYDAALKSKGKMTWKQFFFRGIKIGNETEEQSI